MKKLSYFALALLAAFALSCTPDEIVTPDDQDKDQTEEPSGEEDGKQDEEDNKDEEGDKDDEHEETKTVVLAVSAPADIVAGPLTRTVMLPAGEGYAVNWTATDEITVNGIKPTAKEVDASDAKKASFTFENLTAPYCAAYPATAATAFVGTGATVILPSEQKYVKDSFDPAAAVMLAYAADGEALAFSHAMAYLHLTVSSESSTDNIMSVTVSTKGDEPLCGGFAASFSADGCALAKVDGNTNTSVTLNCGEAGVPMGTPMTVAVPAGTYASGIVVKVTDASSGVTTLTAEEELVMEAGRLYTAELKVVAQGIYDLAGYNAFAADVNAGDYSAWVDPKDGEVNLYADIESKANFTYISYFDGVFDGNGHTISCSEKNCPLFNVLAETAVVKNLTTGGVYAGFNNAGEQAFASFARVNLGTIQNCRNITSGELASETAVAFGGFVGQNGGLIKDCVNDGNILLTMNTNSSVCYGGGFAAWGHTVENGAASSASKAGKFENCVNNGRIIVTVDNGASLTKTGFGGICGVVTFNGVEFTGCKNGASAKVHRIDVNGKATNNECASAVGGIVGRSAIFNTSNPKWLDMDGNIGRYNTRFISCVNEGEVVNSVRNGHNFKSQSGDEKGNKKCGTGGIVGALVGDASSNAVLEGCSNTGTVRTGYNATNNSHVAGGLVGMARNVVLTNCSSTGVVAPFGEGNITGPLGGFVGFALDGMEINGGTAKSQITVKTVSSPSLWSYGLIVGTSRAAFAASDVVAGGSITVNGESKVTADNFADYLCWNKHFTVTPTFTNCTWGE